MNENDVKKEKLIVILGPTAVEKTALSVELAKRMDTEILSGDSMLVYRGFDIGSAKPTMEERQNVRHHLIDIREPWESYNVTDFKLEAEQLIHDINQRGKIPILAGGTGLYVKSLLEGYQFNTTEGDNEYRASLQKLAEVHGKEYVHAMLEKVNPEAAARLHVNDFRRVIRALEVAELGEEQISQEKRLSEQGDLVYDVYVVGLRRDRKLLYERINKRVDLMLENGLVDEVRRLLTDGISREMQAMKGIGYKETAAALAGEMSMEEAAELIKKSTRHFAKRQFTWYRKMPYIHWYDIDDMSEMEILQTVSKDLAGYFQFMQK